MSKQYEQETIKPNEQALSGLESNASKLIFSELAGKFPIVN